MILKWPVKENSTIVLFSLTGQFFWSFSTGYARYLRSELLVAVEWRPTVSWPAASKHSIVISANGTKWIGGDYEIGRSVRRCVCPSVCLCTRIGGDVHSNERLPV